PGEQLDVGTDVTGVVGDEVDHDVELPAGQRGTDRVRVTDVGDQAADAVRDGAQRGLAPVEDGQVDAAGHGDLGAHRADRARPPDEQHRKRAHLLVPLLLAVRAKITTDASTRSCRGTKGPEAGKGTIK